MTSVGSKGDSFDNALAESIIGLYKSELLTLRGPWRTVEDVELATLAWVDWFNTRRLMWPLGGVPPAEFEATWLEARENEAPSGPGSLATEGGGMKTPAQPSLFEALENQ